MTLTFVLRLAVIYLPPLNAIFDTAPLTAAELFGYVAVSSVVFIAIEIDKWIMRAPGRRDERITGS